MATKKVKATAKKVELTETFEKVQETAKNVNAQVMETASAVVEDVVTIGKEWTNKATETAKTYIEDIKDFDLNKGLNQVKATAKNLNTGALEVTESLVETTLVNGKEWQGVAEKAIKGGLKLADKQQDIVFDTLESVKGQMVKSVVRFRELFSKN
ncbi:MAG: hypothetical protein NXI23_21680 [Bacteroidetes bacterium]|jgi:gas vesicle protein|nr:hypothetical protein [Bacteroidota bacterium]MDF1868338.1 hypothetical protein [Saprospiraceae bacterium]